MPSPANGKPLRLPVGPDTVRMLRLGHPWVIADRYTARWPQIACGALAELADEQGAVQGVALLDPGARVVARLLGPAPLKFDVSWLVARLEAAARLREWLALGETSAWRMVNGEGDGLPGLTIDRYGDDLLVQYYTPAWEPHLGSVVVPALQRTCRPRAIYGKYRPQQTRGKESNLKGRLLYGERGAGPQWVTEHGLSFRVDLEGDLHTGLFLDQRANRVTFRRFAAGRRVLNLFAYTGAFSVVAAAGGACQVTSVDASSRYLDWARDNFRRNGFDPAAHRFIAGDCFAVLAQLADSGCRYDVIFMDPPSFSTVRDSRFTTSGGTSELVRLALTLLSKGGLLVTSSNHQKIDLADYLKELRRGALAAGRNLRVIETAGQGGDFPFPVTFAEGRYLKYVASVAE